MLDWLTDLFSTRRPKRRKAMAHRCKYGKLKHPRGRRVCRKRRASRRRRRR